MPEDMLARMLFALGLVIGLLFLLAWAIKKFGVQLGLPVTLKKGAARLQLVEVTPIDAKHRLVLLRRDDVEHLLLMGGAQPVVIETSIQSNAPEKNAKA